VVVSNAAGTATSVSALLTVNSPPLITTQPQNQTVIAGNAATFNGLASGTAPLAYQWQLRATNLSGASSNIYSIASAQPGQAGDYRVIVTNSYGAATSAPATLFIRLRPLLSLSLAPSNGQPHITLTGTPGDRYVIEASTNFPFWNSVQTVTNANGSVLYSDPGSPGETRKFYRAWLLP
jgi:hypothetical protein